MSSMQTTELAGRLTPEGNILISAQDHYGPEWMLKGPGSIEFVIEALVLERDVLIERELAKDNPWEQILNDLSIPPQIFLSVPREWRVFISVKSQGRIHHRRRYRPRTQYDN